MGKAPLLLLALLFILTGLTYLNFQRLSLHSTPPEEIFTPSEIKSITLFSKSKTKTLNEEEKLSVLQNLSTGMKVKTSFYKPPISTVFPVEKILLESYEGTQYTLNPQFTMEKNIVFAIEEPLGFNYFIERSEGGMEGLITQLVL